MLNFLKRLWNSISFIELVSALTYFVFIIRLHHHSSVQRQSSDFANLLIIFSGAVTIVLLARILSLITRKICILHAITGFLFIMLYVWVGFYHLRTGTLLNFSVIVDNLGLAFYKESAGVISDTLRRKDIIQLWITAILLLLIQFRYRKLNQFVVYRKKWIHFAAVASLYCFFYFGMPYTYEEYTSFAKTIEDYYRPGIDVSKMVSQDYPYLKQIENPRVKNPPNVFVITVESFNANTVLTKSKEGKEYTPFYNSLIKHGIFYKNFYGHSVQTAKGQLAVYCSILPLTKRKVFVDYPEIGFRCLPQILRESGYNTLFFKAFSDINFDNTGNFARNIGFDHIHGMDGDFVSKDEREKYYWGWGIQDDLFYKKFFSFVDKLHAKDGNKKIFAALTTVSNHMKFKKVPRDQQYIYPGKNSQRERYANSIRVSDEYLKTFFDELQKRDYLKNSIVFVTGDHSYPWGEHGHYSSESSYYNENFKTPLVIIGKGIEAKRIEKIFSQVDIAPTILELTGVSTKTSFLGESLFKLNQRPVHLIQPYDGVYLSVIIDSFKFVYHKRTKREFCYNLETDPHEDLDIIATMRDDARYQRFLEEKKRILINDFLVREDRIYPKTL